MFLTNTQMEKDSLRQGDILGWIPIPVIEYIDDIRGVAKIRGGSSYFESPKVEFTPDPRHGDENWFAASGVKVRFCYCAVFSNCCELERLGAANSFSVARLMPIPENIRKSPEKLEILKSNSDPRIHKHYQKYFYVSPQAQLDGRDWVVDFSQITTVPKTAIPEALKRKLLQMDDAHRVIFKIRAGWFITRPSQEELADGPWDQAMAQLNAGPAPSRWQRLKHKLFG